MKTWLRLALGLLLIAAMPAFCGLGVAVGAEPAKLKWTIEGVERTALVFAPAAVQPGGKGAPLVFAFHGHGGNSASAARVFGLQTLWPEALVVYPQGLPTPNRKDPQGLRNGWQCTPGPDNGPLTAALLPGEIGDRDLKFFDALLATLRRKYPVDPRRIYVTGFSNGAHFTYCLWGERARVIAAFAPCAGLVPPGVEITTARPVLHTAGERDGVVKYALQLETIAQIRKLDHCTGETKPWAPGCTLYPSKTKTPVVTFIHPGGHLVPAEAPAQIVRFFRAQILPE